MKKAVSVAVDAGPPWGLYIVDEDGRLWRGEGRAGQAWLLWTEVNTPNNMACDPKVVAENMMARRLG